VIRAEGLRYRYSGADAEFFGADKRTREAAGTGFALATAQADAHVAGAWVPAFEFLGLGLLLATFPEARARGA
jgi:hypothetical protein